MLSHANASWMGLADRGRIDVGLRADLNVIDVPRLALPPPRLVHDLPANGKRLLQSASGYRATIVHGEVVRDQGATTSARPGKLVRLGRA
jgi:N-acyl-D-aspartate/D-glutamate deacylase